MFAYLFVYKSSRVLLWSYHVRDVEVHLRCFSFMCSKFLVPGSRYVEVKVSGYSLSLYHAAFVRPDGVVSLVLCNT